MTWTVTNFAGDSSLTLQTLKPDDLPDLMSALDSGCKYTMYSDSHNEYISVRANSTLLGPIRDATANAIMSRTLHDDYHKVGWSSTGREIWVEDEHGDRTYKNAFFTEIDNIRDFMRFVVPTSSPRQGELDNLSIEPVDTGSPVTKLNITIGVRMLAIAIFGIGEWGLTKIPLNTASDLAAIFSAGLVNLVEEDIIDEEKLETITSNIDGMRNTFYLGVMANRILPKMGIEVHEHSTT